tara:strand:+ start:2800 stop:2988 length:189 start_codon:yes stop_codon:yes gene_type:complete
MDKGIEILKKVKADLFWCERRLRESTDSVEREILEKLIDQNKSWLAECDLLNKLAMQNNCKK